MAPNRKPGKPPFALDPRSRAAFDPDAIYAPCWPMRSSSWSQTSTARHAFVGSRPGLVGSMDRRGHPHDNAKAESSMKTLKVKAVYPMAYETFAEVGKHSTMSVSAIRGSTPPDTRSSAA